MKNPRSLLDHRRVDLTAVALPVDRPRASGFELRDVDVCKAIAVLDSFLNEDEAEQRETFEYLKQALDETRAAHGERPLFSYRQDHYSGSEPLVTISVE